MPRKSSREDRVSAEIDLAHSHGEVRLFRNNVGVLVDRATGRPVAFGLGSKGARPLRGTSDKIGYRSVVVSPEMVGRRVAVFIAIEEKDLGRPTPDQLQFIANVQAAGGIAGVAHSAAEAEAILYPDWLPHRGSMQNPNQSPIVSPPAQLHGTPDLPLRH